MVGILVGDDMEGVGCILAPKPKDGHAGSNEGILAQDLNVAMDNKREGRTSSFKKGLCSNEKQGQQRETPTDGLGKCHKIVQERREERDRSVGDGDQAQPFCFAPQENMIQAQGHMESL